MRGFGFAPLAPREVFMKINLFWMLQKRDYPHNPARVFDGRRREILHERLAWVHLWVAAVVVMLLLTIVTLAMMRGTEAVSRAHWPEAAAMLEGGR